MTALTTKERPLKKDKDKLIALVKSGLSYTDAYRQLRPDSNLKNPSNAVADIIGRRSNFDKKYIPEASVLSPFKKIEITDEVIDKVAGLMVLGKKDSEISLELEISISDLLEITDIIETQDVNERLQFNKRLNYKANYQRIGELLLRGESYPFIMKDVFDKVNNGNSLYSHIRKHFDGKDGFMDWWEEQQEDKKAELDQLEQQENAIKEKYEKRLQKQRDKISALETELVVQKVIVTFCEQKMSKERLREVKDISSLMVKSMKFEGAESLKTIVNIITGIEEYITKG